MWHITRDEVSPDSVPQWSIKLTAIIAVLLVALTCSATKKMGARASVLFTFLKVGRFLNGGTVSLIDDVIDLYVGTSGSHFCAKSVRQDNRDYRY